MTEKKLTKLKKAEILAPAGNMDALKAAVAAGADAVYLGGSMFSARAGAGNFSEEELLKALDHCHLFDVKVYMAVNTLLKESEIKDGQLIRYMEAFYRAGLDAVIVQDPGVLKILRDKWPDLPIHASTQMSITSAYGAAFLKDLGVKRLVTARELSLSEIRSIKEKVDIEIESFVHGAMCYAYSGKCLLSSFLGGRSGNRGRCAQPCRRSYELMLPDQNPAGHKNKEQGKIASEHVMSLKDMCTLSILPQLIEAGIDSFKIEGRMKNPYYVAATVQAYRQIRDEYYDRQLCRQGGDECYDRQLTDVMCDIYNRGGFHSGYYFTEKGLLMAANKRPNHLGLLVGTVEAVKGADVSIRLSRDVNVRDILEISGDIELTSNISAKAGSVIVLKGKELRRIRPCAKVFRTRNNKLLDEIEKNIIEPEKKIKAWAVVRAVISQPLSITIYEGEEAAVRVFGAIVQRAQSKALDKEMIISKMMKTGGSNVQLTVKVEADEEAFAPMSELNALRREALEKFKEAKISAYRR